MKGTVPAIILLCSLFQVALVEAARPEADPGEYVNVLEPAWLGHVRYAGVTLVSHPRLAARGEARP